MANVAQYFEFLISLEHFNFWNLINLKNLEKISEVVF